MLLGKFTIAVSSRTEELGLDFLQFIALMSPLHPLAPAQVKMQCKKARGHVIITDTPELSEGHRGPVVSPPLLGIMGFRYGGYSCYGP